MRKSEARASRATEANRESVERLAENIRLTSLNMAIKAAKLRDDHDSGHIIRNKVRELVTLSLEAVDHVTRALRTLDSVGVESGEQSEKGLAELRRIESGIIERTREIQQLLSGSG